MCLAIEGKIVRINGDAAQIEFGGVLREIRLDLTPEAKVGDCVLVHAGYAIQIVDRDWIDSRKDFDAFMKDKENKEGESDAGDR